MATSFRWVIPPSRLGQVLGEYGRRALAAIGALADFFAAKMQTYAQTNAKWTDRTTNARQGLRGVALKTATAVTIVLFHTMDYGKWLELANQGRFAILLATLQANYGPIMAAVQRLLGGK